MLGSGADRKRKFAAGGIGQQQQQQHFQPVGASAGNGSLIRRPPGMQQQQQHHHHHHQAQHQMQQQHQHQQQLLLAMASSGLINAASAAVSAAASGGGGGNKSCVIFVSEIPANTSELELKRVFQEFGKLESILTIPSKHQALVEFLRLTDAERLVSTYQSGYAISANGGNLNVNFSNRARIDPGQESYQSATPQTCLLLTFYNVRMEFSCESIRQICSPYGLLDRCLLIRQQDGLFRAVLEFEKLEDAVLTKPNLNGANMYANCNAIRCEYARHTAFEYLASRESVIEEYRYEASGDADRLLGAGGIAAKRPRLPLPGKGMPPVSAAASSDFAAASLGAAGLLMQQQLEQAGVMPLRHQLPGGMIVQQQQLPMQQQQQQQQQLVASLQDGPGHSVVVVRGLSPQMNCDRLFNILCLYGNVVRIKFITSREGFALVQMMETTSAQQAVTFLHGQCILGGSVKVSHSDQGALKRATKEFCLADGSQAEKSYDATKLNRFMNQESVTKNQASLGKTGRSLYYWGCPDGTSEAKIREVLKLAGASDPEKISPQNDKGSTGWITFANINDATDAICLANHAPIGGETGKMKLSYAVKK